MARGYRDTDSRRYFDWLYYSAIDLRCAELIIDEPHCYNMVAFHCQQSIEKGFKGFLLWKKHKLFDGHNLPWLCKQAMQIDDQFRQFLPAASRINRYYIEARYPADFLLQLDLEDAKQAIADTKEILRAIQSLVKFDFASYRQ